jgi:hypothetical protein
MSEPWSPEQEAKAQELAARITARSADAILEVARRLVATTDDTLFGDTEFAPRDPAQGIAADAYAEHRPQTVGTPPAPPNRAAAWVALTDGGAGWEDFVRRNFPRVEPVILDFYRAADYLAKLASASHPTDEAAALAQTRSWSRLLRDEGGAVLLAVLEGGEWPGVRGLGAVRAEVLGYIRNQAHRMDYPSHEANGWYIGSGAVESACKTVVGQRLKGAGMRWGEAGAHALGHVRALSRSEHSQWTDFWRRSLAA